MRIKTAIPTKLKESLLLLGFLCLSKITKESWHAAFSVAISSENFRKVQACGAFQWIIPSKAAPRNAPAQRMTAAKKTSSRVLAAIDGLRPACLAEFVVLRFGGSDDHLRCCRKLWAGAARVPNLFIRSANVSCHRLRWIEVLTGNCGAAVSERVPNDFLEERPYLSTANGESGGGIRKTLLTNGRVLTRISHAPGDNDKRRGTHDPRNILEST